mmetsp:Transcript_823/g.2150  ORF Transcript_823/g.2150 Transcript_823/m.2150 type:complete len:205 (+) Transcript_823:740-1354(+)
MPRPAEQPVGQAPLLALRRASAPTPHHEQGEDGGQGFQGGSSAGECQEWPQGPGTQCASGGHGAERLGGLRGEDAADVREHRSCGARGRGRSVRHRMHQARRAPATSGVDAVVDAVAAVPAESLLASPPRQRNGGGSAGPSDVSRRRRPPLCGPQRRGAPPSCRGTRRMRNHDPRSVLQSSRRAGKCQGTRRDWSGEGRYFDVW